MRYLVTSLVATFALAAMPGESQAQYRYFNRNYAVTPLPYYNGPPVFNSSAFVSPNGYRSYYNSGIYPGPFGYNAFSSTGTSWQPYVAGPWHSVYFNPFTNSYQYMGSPLNTPNYYYNFSNPGYYTPGLPYPY